MKQHLSQALQVHICACSKVCLSFSMCILYTIVLNIYIAIQGIALKTFVVVSIIQSLIVIRCNL